MTPNAAAVIEKNSSASLLPQRPESPAHRVPEAVAHAAHGEDQLGRLGLGLELLAQVADVHVDRARVAVGGVAPDALEQHRAAEHPARGARQRGEDLELDVGEPHALAAHRTTRRFSKSICRSPSSIGSSKLLLGRRQRGAAQHGLDAAAELAHRERLGDVVVGAELEAEHLVDLLGLRGEHDDRHGAARADLRGRPRSRRTCGQHHVEHHQVEGVLAQPVERLLAVERRHDVVALLAQGIGQQLLDRLSSSTSRMRGAAEAVDLSEIVGWRSRT